MEINQACQEQSRVHTPALPVFADRSNRQLDPRVGHGSPRHLPATLHAPAETPSDTASAKQTAQPVFPLIWDGMDDGR